MKEWQGISEFVAVADLGTFTRAAEQLGMSVAQVSRSVAELEKRLQIKLLYRSTRHVSLTEEGALYLQHCRHLVQGLEEANRAMGNLQASPRGSLKVTAPVFFGETRIAPLLNDFIARYDEIELELILSNRQEDLIGGRFDLAIRLGQLNDSSLIARRLGSRTHHIVASPAYISQYGEPLHPDDLSQHCLLAGTLEHWRVKEQGKTKLIRPARRLRCNSGLALLDAAQKGLGLAQLPDYYLGKAFQDGTLRPVLESFREANDGIWALYPQNRHLSPKIRQLVDYLHQQLNPA